MGLAKAMIIVKHTQQVFTVQFNPEEYTLNKDNNFASQAIPGLSAPLLQFVHGNMGTLEMELLFDSYDTEVEKKEDVRVVTNAFMKLMEIDNELHAPPVLEFAWGAFHYDCVLARANQKFILFGNDGSPLRARITATFNQYIDPEIEVIRLNLHSTDITKLHIVKSGETIDRIAATYYNNAQLWRPIAIANQIYQPRNLFPGQSLRIPPLPYTDPDTGEVVN